MLQKSFTKLVFQLFFFDNDFWRLFTISAPGGREIGLGKCRLFNKVPERVKKGMHVRSNVHSQVNNLYGK